MDGISNDIAKYTKSFQKHPSYQAWVQDVKRRYDGRGKELDLQFLIR